MASWCSSRLKPDPAEDGGVFVFGSPPAFGRPPGRNRGLVSRTRAAPFRAAPLSRAPQVNLARWAPARPRSTDALRASGAREPLGTPLRVRSKADGII